MNPSFANALVVLAAVGAIVVLGVRYLDRLHINRPPVGTYNRSDVVFMVAVLAILPPLYLALPPWALVAVFALFLLVVLHYTLGPALPRPIPLAAAALLVAGDVVVFAAVGGSHAAFLAVNGVVLGIAVIGVCNLYVQSGMRAEHVALFAGVLTVYDYVATLGTSLMTRFLAALSDIPLAPVLAWGGPERGIGIGLGDLLVLLLWTLAARKAYGRVASLIAASSGLATVAAIFALFWLDVYNEPVPVMVVLGPAVVAQQLLWSRRLRERTVHEWRVGLPALAQARATPAEPGTFDVESTAAGTAPRRVSVSGLV